MILRLTVPDAYVSEWNAALAANNPGKTPEQLNAISGRLIADVMLAELLRQKREASKRQATRSKSPRASSR